jgi:hypothetical protein
VLLRGANLEIGDVVYAYDRATDSLLIGNAEGAADGRLFVSFARPSQGRRGQAIPHDRAALILPAELGGAPEAPGFRPGEMVLAIDEPPQAIPYAVEAPADETSRALSVRRLKWDADAGWRAAAQPELIETARVLRPSTLALVARWRYARPVDPLVDIVTDDVGESLDSVEDAYLSIDGIDVPVRANLRMSDHRVELRLGAHTQIAGLVADVVPDKLVDERVRPGSRALPRWDARVAVAGASLSWNESSGDSAHIDVRISRMTVLREEAPVVATREIYVGAPIGAWSHPFMEREPLPNPILVQYGIPPSTLQFKTFGNRTIIYRPPQHSPGENPYTAVLRIGEPLDDDRHAVLSAFLGYITGGRCVNVLTETYAVDRKLSSEYVNRGSATSRRQYPVPLESPSDYTPHVVERIPAVLEAFERWRRADRRAFEAVFHHYGEGVDSPYPTTRILRLAVAFEAFVNLVTGDTAVNENIADNDVFFGLRDELRATLTDYTGRHPDRIDAAKAARYRAKIDAANLASNTRRMKRFYDLVPIALSAGDLKLLRRLRNESVHLGYVGEESTSEGLRRNSEDADRLVDILNRAILAHAGYAGPVAAARGSVWIEARSGGPYALPPLPRRENIPIQINTTVSAMTAEEAAAATRLAGIGRTARGDASDGTTGSA